MKKLFDYLPVIVFFALYFLTGRDIMMATWGILIASIFQVSVGWLVWRKVDRMHQIVFFFTLIFGGLTLAFNNEVFIKWRPSVINFSFAVILLGGQLMRDRSLLQRMCESLMISGLGYIVPLARRNWNILNTALISYFLFIAALNLYIAYNFSTDFWVNFKLIGFTAINFVFYIGLMLYVYKSLPEAERNKLFGDDNRDNNRDNNKDATQGTPDDQDTEKDPDAVRHHH